MNGLTVRSRGTRHKTATPLSLIVIRGIDYCYCCGIFETPIFIDIISISFKIGVTSGVSEFGTFRHSARVSFPSIFALNFCLDT